MSGCLFVTRTQAATKGILVHSFVHLVNMINILPLRTKLHSLPEPELKLHLQTR